MISLSEVLPIHLTTMFICHKMKFQVVRSIVSVGGGVAKVTPSLGSLFTEKTVFGALLCDNASNQELCSII